MSKAFTILVLVILSGIAVFAQTTEPCRLKLSQAPTLRDLRLGMSVAEASAALGVQLKPYEVESRVSFIRSKNEYVREYSQALPVEFAEYNRNMRTSKLGNFRADVGWNNLKESLRPNISNLQLEFFQDKLDSILVTYGFKYAIWSGQDEFVKDISASNKLPLSGWTYDVKSNRSSLSCAGFDIKVDDPYLSNGRNLRVALTDHVAQKTLDDLAKARWMEEKAAEEKFKKAFAL